MMKKNASDEKKALRRESLLFFFYPPKCASCGVVGYKNLCPVCREALEDAFEPKKYIAAGGNGFADAMFCLFPYKEPVVQHLLHGWKQVDYRDYPDIFTPYILRFLKKKLLPENIHKITYLPRRKPARRKIGFDQAQRIGSLFSEKLGIPLEPLLIRQGHSKIQHKQTYERREKNVRGAFRCETEFSGETILLIDDIVTSGASAREAARILKQAGAMKVYILSIAH